MREKNIAEKIRDDRRPEGEMFTLSGEAKRLRSSLAVAEKRIEAAYQGEETGHLTATAEYTRDQLEEELSRTAFRMEVLKRGREMRDAPPVEDPDGTARASMLSDALLTVYCVLRDVPNEAFGGETPERERYAHMGAHGCSGGRQRGDGALRGGTVRLDVSHGRHRAGVSYGVSRPSLLPMLHGVVFGQCLLPRPQCAEILM